MNNPLAWSPAQRCLAASGISYWQRYRLGPSPWLTIATIALCTWVVIFSTYFYGLFTHLYAGVAIVAAWVVGLTLFTARQMGVNLLGTLLFNSVLLAGAYAGQIPYAPFFNTTAASIGQINPGLLRPMNAITMLLLGVVLAIVYFIVARWKQREAELLAVGETLGKANGIISRYVAVQLADEVRNGNYAALERHERRKLTLFFSDIKNFSTIADAIEPEDLSLLLNDYLSEMTLIAQRYGATIDKFVGDAIMIFFGAPHWHQDRTGQCGRFWLPAAPRIHRDWSPGQSGGTHPGPLPARPSADQPFHLVAGA
ncbi:MAG: adenylate/guanylate cyclase domain-containing protein [Rhodoferax sp.]|nr:adenylate/guanylate cyclase domain-containing protein [Rhodoferax sp.]MDP1529601.1 adenylate/guanylate cyclase domain-containing protein [Rhodoferax sp.]MDP1944944.1 adenylate/guanylate cyclase domain-containing protein [Rhodoferax sp.]